MRRYVHTAVGEGNCVCVAGHTLLLTVVGAGGRSHGITSVDIVRVDGLPTWCMPGRERRKTRHAKKKKNNKETDHDTVKMHLEAKDSMHPTLNKVQHIRNSC